MYRVTAGGASGAAVDLGGRAVLRNALGSPKAARSPAAIQRLFLHELDCVWVERVYERRNGIDAKLVRYADDIIRSKGQGKRAQPGVHGGASQLRAAGWAAYYAHPTPPRRLTSFSSTPTNPSAGTCVPEDIAADWAVTRRCPTGCSTRNLASPGRHGIRAYRSHAAPRQPSTHTARTVRLGGG